VRPNLHLARALRRNATDAEKRIWTQLRDRRFEGFKFRRQYAVGPYILDFYCTLCRLAIELDGGQHMTEPGELKDAQRSAYLAERGIAVLRFSNLDVLRLTDAVMEKILEVLVERCPLTPSLSPVGGEGERGRGGEDR